MKLWRSRGVALISVLMLMVLLAALGSAFIGVNRTNLTLMSNADRYAEVYQACVSGVDYLWYRIENDRNFGKTAFSGATTEVYPSSNPIVEVTMRGRAGDPLQNSIEGKLLATGQEFRLQFVNNLNNTATAGRGGLIAPPDSVRVWSLSDVGSVTRQLDTVLRVAPLVSSTVVAGGMLSMDLDAGSNADAGWWLETKDPSRNRIRANGDIYVPNCFDDPVTPRVNFVAPKGLENRLKDPYGAIEGHQEIFMENTNGRRKGYRLSAQDAVRDQAGENSKGAFLPNSGEATVPELSPASLRSDATTSVNLNPGTYEFRTEGTVHKLVHIASDGTSSVLRSYDQSKRLSSRVQNLTTPFGETIAVVNLATRKFRIPANTQVTSHGSLTFSGDSLGVPQVLLGSADQMGYLSVTSGDMVVEGSIVGMGAVVAESGSIEIQAKSTLSTTPDNGVALFANESVRLDRPGAGAGDGLPVDWDAFNEALGASRSLDDWYRLDEGDQEREAEDFSERTVVGEGDDFDLYWLGLVEEFGEADGRAIAAKNDWLREGRTIPSDDPDEPPREIEGGGGITMERYIGLREYMRSLEKGVPDPKWLDTRRRRREIRDKLVDQIGFYQELAGKTWVQKGPEHVESYWNKLSGYFRGDNPFRVPYRPDMAFKGLVYARDFEFNAYDKGIEIEGAIVTEGDLRIRNALGARFVYNPELLKKLATDQSSTTIGLEQIFWNFR